MDARYNHPSIVTWVPFNEGWAAPGFDDSGWPRGPGGFGTKITPNSVVRTEWKTPAIWLRRTFELPGRFKPNRLELELFMTRMRGCF